MSSVTIITTLIVLLAALVCYAFVSQTISQKREQKKRLTAALKSRSRNFKFMLSGFPKGFLPKELGLLVQRSLIDVCEQLSKLEPDEPSHLQDLQIATAQLAEQQRQPAIEKSTPLESPQQVKEVKMCLEELNRFIHQSENRNNVSASQTELYRNQIKQMALQLSVDSYCQNGARARQADKTRLAIHYYDSALKLLIRESRGGRFDQRIGELRKILQELNFAILEEQGGYVLTEEEQAEQEELEREWSSFSEEEIWKKKQIYD